MGSLTREQRKEIDGLLKAAAEKEAEEFTAGMSAEAVQRLAKAVGWGAPWQLRGSAGMNTEIEERSRYLRDSFEYKVLQDWPNAPGKEVECDNRYLDTFIHCLLKFAGLPATVRPLTNKVSIVAVGDFVSDEWKLKALSFVPLWRLTEKVAEAKRAIQSLERETEQHRDFLKGVEAKMTALCSTLAEHESRLKTRLDADEQKKRERPDATETRVVEKGGARGSKRKRK